MTFGRALTNSSHKCHESEVRIKPTISEMKDDSARLYVPVVFIVA